MLNSMQAVRYHLIGEERCYTDGTQIAERLKASGRQYSPIPARMPRRSSRKLERGICAFSIMFCWLMSVRTLNRKTCDGVFTFMLLESGPKVDNGSSVK